MQGPNQWIFIIYLINKHSSIFLPGRCEYLDWQIWIYISLYECPYNEYLWSWVSHNFNKPACSRLCLLMYIKDALNLQVCFFPFPITPLQFPLILIFFCFDFLHCAFVSSFCGCTVTDISNWHTSMVRGPIFFWQYMRSIKCFVNLMVLFVRESVIGAWYFENIFTGN